MTTTIENFLYNALLYDYDLKYTYNGQYVNIFKTDECDEVIEFQSIDTSRFIEEVMYYLGIEKHKT